MDRSVGDPVWGSRAVREGFTLIELLVVCSLISLLAAMLFSVFSQARRAAAASDCLSNLHQLATAIRMYASDYDDAYFSTGGPPDEMDNLGRLWIWPLLPYVRNTVVFHCPGDPTTDARRTVCGATSELWNSPTLPSLSYGANTALAVATTLEQPEARLNDLAYPALTLLVADCSEPWGFGPVFTDPHGVRWSHIAYANAPPVPFLHTAFHGGHSGVGQERHGTGSNIAYADGHAQFLAADRFYYAPRVEPTQTIAIERPILDPLAIPPP